MDADKYKVGIVIPSYQQGEYLERSINSVIENMRNVSIKLVVMDGGSTDGSVEIIKKYERHIFHWDFGLRIKDRQQQLIKVSGIWMTVSILCG